MQFENPFISELSVIIEGDGGVSIPEEGEFVPQLPPDYAVTDFDKLILSFDPYIAYDVSTLEKNGEQYILGNVVLCDTDKLNVIPQNINSIDNAADFDKKGRYWGDIQMNADSEISDNAIKMAKKEWEHPWYLSNFLEDIWRNIEELQTSFQHTFREGNKVADLLANHGYEEVDIQFFDNAPLFIKPALFNDKIGTKFLRRYSASLPPD